MIVWSCGHTMLCSRSQCRTLLLYLKLSQWRLDAHWLQMTDPKMHTHSSTVTRSVQSRCFCFCVTLYKMRSSKMKIRTLPSFTYLWRVAASMLLYTQNYLRAWTYTLGRGAYQDLRLVLTIDLPGHFSLNVLCAFFPRLIFLDNYRHAAASSLELAWAYMLCSNEGILAVFVFDSFIAEAGLLTVKFVQMFVHVQAWPSLKASCCLHMLVRITTLIYSMYVQQTKIQIYEMIYSRSDLVKFYLNELN